MTPEQQLEDLKNQVNTLKRKIEELNNPATISEQFLDALVKKGFFRYDNVKIITYTNPSGRDFYSVFAKYFNENIVLDIGNKQNFLKIESINTSTDTITITNHGLSDGNDVSIATTNVPPGGLSPQTIYYIVSSATNTFKLSTSPGGAAVNITSVGSGAHYIRPL